MALGQPSIPNKTTFTFSTGAKLSAALAFTAINAGPTRHQGAKRARPRADVDGEDSQYAQKKKRRLRLNLITSRLSRPFATPTTYIIIRSNARISRWTQQKSAGRNLLRKAALMNWTRIKVASAWKSKCENLASRELAVRSVPHDKRFESISEEKIRPCIPNPPKILNHHVVRPPSPLSIYEAIDLEGDPYGDDDSGDEYVVESDVVNSDFSKRETGATDWDDDPFIMDNGQRWSQLQDSKEILELLTEEDSQKEVSFAQFGS